MSRGIAATVLLVLAACSPAGPAADRSPRPAASLRNDVAALGTFFEESHADLSALVPVEEWRTAVMDLEARIDGMSSAEALVELMRLSTLPARTGGGDGHSGIFPLDVHDATLHLFPLRLYEFPDGLYVVDASDEHRALVGARLVALGDTPAERALDLVEPLVPRDNAMTVRARAPQFLMVLEVLNGLGVLDEAGPAEMTFETYPGDELTASLEAVPADEFAEEMDVWHPMIPPSLPSRSDAPLYLRHADEAWWSTPLVRDGVVYVQYNRTLGDSFRLGRRLVRLVKGHGARGVVLDLRHNPGGENAASAGLIEGLRHPRVRRLPLAVLVGRATFSAAGNLALHLRRELDPIFVGEPTGFSTHFFGDPESTELPEAGLTVNAGGVLWTETPEGSLKEPLVPDVRREATAGQYFGGQDPVLGAALRALRRVRR